MEKLKYAQELIKATPIFMSGFNQFINGVGKPKFSDYGNKPEWYVSMQGYEHAYEMAKEKAIAFTHVFKCNKDACFPFSYGGFMVCNACGQKSVEQDWWKIKVEKDGDMYCCHGLDFINLQESDNYAFGETFESAIKEYSKVILNIYKV